MPVLGLIDFGLSSDFKNFSTLVNALSTDEGILEDDDFYNSLKKDNRLDLNMKMDIISLGSFVFGIALNVLPLQGKDVL